MRRLAVLGVMRGRAILETGRWLDMLGMDRRRSVLGRRLSLIMHRRLGRHRRRRLSNRRMVVLLGRLRQRRSNPTEGHGSQGNTRKPKPAPMRR